MSDLVPDLPEIIDSLDKRITNLEEEPESNDVNVVTPDLTIQNLTSNVVRYNEFYGQQRVRVTLDWSDIVPVPDTEFIRDQFDHYEVAYEFVGDTTPGGKVTTKVSKIIYNELPVNQNIKFSVTAVTESGLVGTSAEITVFTDRDYTPPIQPSTPVIVPGLKSLTVVWDGKDINGAAMEVDFAYLEIHMETSGPTFTPTTGTLVDKLLGQGQSSFILPDYGIRYVRFVAVDVSTNRSVVSTAASGTPLKAVETDLNVALPGDIAYRDEGNLIVDGSFESSNIRSVRDSLAKTAGVSWDNTAGIAYQGSWCMKFTGDATTSKYWRIAEDRVNTTSSGYIAVEALSKYYVSFRHRGIGVTGSIQIIFDWLGPTKSYVSNMGTPSINAGTTTGEWQLYEGIISIPADISYASIYVRTSNQTAGTWYIDTVQVRRVTGTMLIEDAAITTAKIANLAVNNAKITNISGTKIDALTIDTSKLSVGVLSTNLVLDPGFEEVYSMGGRTTNGWAIATHNDPGITVNKNAQSPRSGNSCIAFSVPANGKWMLADSNNISVTAGATYKLVTYGSASAVGSVLSLRVIHYNGTSWTEVNLSSVTTTAGNSFVSPTPEQYIKLSAEFTVPAGSSLARLRLVVVSPATLSTVIRYDDCSFIKMGGTGASELTSAGLRLFNGNGEEVGAFVSNRPNYFSVSQNDVTLAAIRGDGTASFQSATFVNDLSVQGKLLGNTYSKAVTAWGVSNEGATTRPCDTIVGVGEFAFTHIPGRMSLVHCRPPAVQITSGSAPAHVIFKLHYTTDGSAPLVSSPVMWNHEVDLVFAGMRIAPPPITWPFTHSSSTPMQVRCLISAVKYSGSGNVQIMEDQFSVPIWYVMDGGPAINASPWTASLGGGTGAPATQTYQKDYGVSSWATYHQNGTQRTGVSSMYQGYYSSNWGNQYSRANFNTGSDLTGAAVNWATLTFNCQWTYAGGGGQAIIVRGDGASVGNQNVANGGIYTVGIPSGALPGTNPIYGFGQAPNADQYYYSYYNPAMTLTVNYTK